MKQARKTKVEQARDWLLKEIRNGNFPRGTALPPERELAEQVGVSYMTLRKAVGMLVDENFLDRNHGSGTYVRSEISETKVQKQLGLVVPAWSAPETLDVIMHLSEACQKENWLRPVVGRTLHPRPVAELRRGRLLGSAAYLRDSAGSGGKGARRQTVHLQRRQCRIHRRRLRDLLSGKPPRRSG